MSDAELATVCRSSHTSGTVTGTTSSTLTQSWRQTSRSSAFWRRRRRWSEDAGRGVSIPGNNWTVCLQRDRCERLIMGAVGLDLPDHLVRWIGHRRDRRRKDRPTVHRRHRIRFPSGCREGYSDLLHVRAGGNDHYSYGLSLRGPQYVCLHFCVVWV